MKSTKPQTRKASLFALLCLSALVAGCGAKEELDAPTISQNVAASVYASDRGAAASSIDVPIQTRAVSAAAASSENGDPSNRSIVRTTLPAAPINEEQEKATASADAVTPSNIENPAASQSQTTRSAEAETKPAAAPKATSTVKQAPSQKAAQNQQTKSAAQAAVPAADPTPVKPGELKGSGLYIGRIDTHSIEIQTSSGALVIQYDEESSQLLDKITEHDNGTPVDFTYTQKEVTVEGEKYIERWLTSIKER
ncbi:cytoskeletal protein RodZ [Paenibacillus phyllosphaerae]|uniref:Cytoskeletal protein RodZ n=1 Tax=Paenibacillus phyllosphaerae TaxID=274593 RepID=A0A7W5FPZ2_9BACL|nr:hypothetical protein [Paenibacillus phyllosphaerae]MBB3112931.1 cytoskeletal protein RodZ [Paenibacillus phyllosphaerae]